jgi:hypothetical protein
MDDNSRDMAQIPYIVYEGSQARSERLSRRLIMVIIILIATLLISNGAWLYAWLQYDYSGTSTETTQDYWQDGNGYNNINTGSQGDVTNGTTAEDSEKDTNQNAETEGRK